MRPVPEARPGNGAAIECKPSDRFDRVIERFCLAPREQKIAGPSHREGGSAAVIQAVQKRPLASKGVAKAHAKSIRAKLGVRFDARPRAARAHRPHSHNVVTQDAAASGRIQTQCRYIPNAARTSADTARPCRIPMHLPPRPGCRSPYAVTLRSTRNPATPATSDAARMAAFAMAMVAGADYDLVFKEGHEPKDWDGFCDAFDAFCALEQITVLKATKKSSLTADIRPMIKSCRLDRKSRVITMSLSTGSSANLKPELVMEAFYKGIGSDWDPAVESYQYSMQINRRETYALGENGEWIALEALGEVIE